MALAVTQRHGHVRPEQREYESLRTPLAGESEPERQQLKRHYSSEGHAMSRT